MGRITLKDIASDLNVSIGTVNRALNNKAEINEETKQKILKRAEELNYKTNAIAKSLGSKKTINIVFANPRSFGEFYRDIEAGILYAISQYEDYNIKLKNVYFDGFEDENAYEKLKTATEENIDAVIMVSIHDDFLKSAETLLNEKKIPLIVLDGDFSFCDCLCRICVNTYKSGQMAGTLMKKFLRNDEEAIVILGNKEHLAHKTKREGFLNAFYDNKNYQLSFTDEESNYREVKRLLTANPKIRGIYSTTSYSKGVVKAIAELGKEEHVFFIGTDITDVTKGFIEQGGIDLLLYQAPFEQGEAAIDIFYKYFFLNQIPDNVIYIRPEIITKYNFEHYYIGG